MLSRKHMIIVALTIVSILLGSLLYSNLAFGANGSSESWGAIRFVEPNETFEDQGIWKDAATFTWIPKNSTNNAIIGDVRVYYEYKHEVVDGYVYCKLQVIGGGQVWEYPVGAYWAKSTWNYNWTDMGAYIVPYPFNQPNYTIKFQVRCDPSYPIAYVRNINIIILVADGMEPGKYYSVTYYPPPLGGTIVSANKLELLAPYIGLGIGLTIGALVSIVYIKTRKDK